MFLLKKTCLYVKMKKSERKNAVSNVARRVYNRNKLFILYGLFGILTTLANFFAFVICTHIYGDEYYIFNNAVAWFAGVVVAFITNKLWVFNSKSWRFSVAGKEFAEFTFARLLSFFFEEVGLILFVSFSSLGQDTFSFFGYQMTTQVIVKLILSIGVVISNYVVSKRIIFKANNKKPKE